MTRATLLLAALMMLTAPVAKADSVTDRLLPIQKEWAIIKYETPDKDKQITAIRGLQAKAAALEAAAPARAEPKIWHAITLATEASFERGLSSLPLVKKSKNLLEEAIKIDGTALNGLGYTYLGSLYDQVPGWPISFGDWEDASAMFKKALEISPDDIDANYFYGQHLASRKNYDGAVLTFKKALGAPLRPNRQLADEGRRAELRVLIAENEIKSKRPPGSDVNK